MTRFMQKMYDEKKQKTPRGGQPVLANETSNVDNETGLVEEPPEAIMEKYGYKSFSELVDAKKKKEEQLSRRGSGKTIGISSLIGVGSTLG